jgi:hypothetical protein
MGHIMKCIKPQEYILEKKLCLSNKHLVIFWVISICHADYFVFPIVTQDWLWFFLFYEGFNYCQHIILIHDRHISYFWFKTGIPNIVCVQSNICDIITKTKYHFRYLLKPHGAHREIYKTTGVSIGRKKNVVRPPHVPQMGGWATLEFLFLFYLKKKKAFKLKTTIFFQ